MFALATSAFAYSAQTAPSGCFEGAVPFIIDVKACIGDTTTNLDINVKIAREEVKCPTETHAISATQVTFPNVATTGDCMGDALRAQSKDPTKYYMDINSDGTLTFQSDGYPPLKMTATGSASTEWVPNPAKEALNVTSGFPSRFQISAHRTCGSDAGHKVYGEDSGACSVGGQYLPAALNARSDNGWTWTAVPQDGKYCLNADSRYMSSHSDYPGGWDVQDHCEKCELFSIYADASVSGVYYIKDFRGNYLSHAHNEGCPLHGEGHQSKCEAWELIAQ